MKPQSSHSTLGLLGSQELRLTPAALLPAIGQKGERGQPVCAVPLTAERLDEDAIDRRLGWKLINAPVRA